MPLRYFAIYCALLGGCLITSLGFAENLRFHAPIEEGTLVSKERSRTSRTLVRPNFMVAAAGDSGSQLSAEQVREIQARAERLRKSLAVDWLGKELDGNWSNPIPIIPILTDGTALSGKTSFNIQNGEVYDWKMVVKGNEKGILDTVLPHEIMHAILATVTRKSVPLWLSEGIATCNEAQVDQEKIARPFARYVQDGKMIPFREMFATEAYPRDKEKLALLYAQSHSAVQFLVEHGGKQNVIEFLKAGVRHKDQDWSGALKQYYGYDSIEAFESAWLRTMRERVK